MGELIRREGCKVLYVLGVPHQAEKIVKKDNNIIGYVDEKPEWIFPNITNIDDFQLEEGQEYDVEVDEIAQLKIIQAEQFETILELLGGM